VLAVVYQRARRAVRFCNFRHEKPRGRAFLRVVYVLADHGDVDALADKRKRRLRRRDYDLFARLFGGGLRGRLVVTAGLGGMGGAQPLAATMAGASMLAIECRQSSIDMRLRTRYVDEQATDLDDALARIERYCAEGKARSVALLGNAAEILPELVRRGVRPDAVTDQTSAHDPLHGYLPAGWTVERWLDEQKHAPERVVEAAKHSMRTHVEAMLRFADMGVAVFDYGNNLRQMAKDAGCKDAFDFPGFVPAYIRPLFCRGIGPFRWVALSGDPEDIAKTDAKVKELIPNDPHLHRWLDMAKERIAFQGLPARICWVGLGDRHRLALAFNEMVRSGELKAPIVIGRDHLDSGSVASPNRETEAMLDGSDAVSDWPLLNALANTASGATWVSLHHGGGVGMGYSQHSGVVIVADGTEAAARRLARVAEVRVERERPMKDRHPTLRFLRDNKDFIRARYDRLRERLVTREGEALPELPLVAVSEAMSVTLSGETPAPCAAICTKTV